VLPEPERLRKSGLFQRVYSNRKTVSTELVSLYILAKQPRSSARLPLAGFVATKKILPKAVARNRAKRRLREAYRLVRQEAKAESRAEKQQEEFRLTQWYALVFVAQADVPKADFADIIKSVRQCLQKANQKFGVKKAPSSHL
jgi:ribonuclease P protein component